MSNRLNDSVSKELRPLLRLARKQGWSFHWNGSGHLAMISPDGRRVTTSSKLVSARKLQNLTAELRRAGLQIPR